MCALSSYSTSMSMSLSGVSSPRAKEPKSHAFTTGCVLKYSAICCVIACVVTILTFWFCLQIYAIFLNYQTLQGKTFLLIFAWCLLRMLPTPPVNCLKGLFIKGLQSPWPPVTSPVWPPVRPPLTRQSQKRVCRWAVARGEVSFRLPILLSFYSCTLLLILPISIEQDSSGTLLIYMLGIIVFRVQRYWDGIPCPA